MTTSGLSARVVWTRLDVPGAEHFFLSRTASGWQLAGTVVLVEQDSPALLRYAVTCDLGWCTRAVEVEHVGASERRLLRLKADGLGRWWREGEEMHAVAGCVDVDLSFTPASNVLPIRRLGLGVGAHADLIAAWVRLPELEPAPLRQTYSRLASHRYRYASGDGAFSTTLTVDDAGVVKEYPGLWSRAD